MVDTQEKIEEWLVSIWVSRSMAAASCGADWVGLGVLGEVAGKIDWPHVAFVWAGSSVLGEMDGSGVLLTEIGEGELYCTFGTGLGSSGCEDALSLFGGAAGAGILSVGRSETGVKVGL
jgi:hypothetical protein